LGDILTMKKLQLFIHLLSICAGGLIYICFRSSDLMMFRWFDYLHCSDAISQIRNISNVYKIENSDWLIYSLPDGLWMFSFTTIILYIWRNTINRKNFAWIIIMPIIAFCTEICQKYDLINGTYDTNDLFAYLFGFIFSCIFFSNSFQIIKNKVS
jgi:hypothetical protein